MQAATWPAPLQRVEVDADPFPEEVQRVMWSDGTADENPDAEEAHETASDTGGAAKSCDLNG